MTQSPSEPAQLDPESQYSQLLVEYDEALAASDDVSTVSSQPFSSHLANEEFQCRFSRVQACLQLLDQDRRRQSASVTQATPVDKALPSREHQSPDLSYGDVQTSGDSRSQLAEERAKIPRQIGRFRVIRRLGSGGFGVVFLAADPVLRRQVAIKMPLASIFQSQELHARFLRECRAAAKLDHPGIVRVLESGDVQGIPYQVAEFVDGERLSDLLRREKLSARSAAVMVRSLADALQHAHDHGVLHRDIKPDNILLQRLPIAALQQQAEDATADQSVLPINIRTEPIPRITDFGLARVSDDDTALSRSGTLVGTPKYMSPEQLKGQTAAHGPQSDIYSLGVVLYELLTGTVPFLEAVTLQSRIAVSDKSVAPFRSWKPGISKDLETICLKCLQLRPSDRYQSAGELRDDLARYLDGRPTLARPIPVYEQFFRWVIGNRVLAAMLGTVVLSILVVTIQAIRNDRATRGQNATLSSTLSQLTEEKQRADESLTLANTNRIAAEQSETRFRDIAWLAQQREYSTSMMQASNLWHAGDILEMNRAIAPFRSKLAHNVPGFELRYLWNQGKSVRPWPGHARNVCALEFTNDGKEAYSIGEDKILRWNAKNGNVEASWRLEGDASQTIASVSVNSLRAVISRKLEGRNVDDVVVWDLTVGRVLMRREFPLHEVTAVDISTDGMTVVIGGTHNPTKHELLPFAQVWRPDSDSIFGDETTFRSVRDGQTSVQCHMISAISFVPGQDEVVVSMISGAKGELWHHQLMHVTLDLKNSEHPFTAPTIFGNEPLTTWQQGLVRKICFSNDAQHVGVLIRHDPSDRFGVEVWDFRKRARVQIFDSLNKSIDTITFDATGTKLGIGLVVQGAIPKEKPVSGKTFVTTPRNEFQLWNFRENTVETVPYKAVRQIVFLKPSVSDFGEDWIVGESGGTLNAWHFGESVPFQELAGHYPREAWDLTTSIDGSTLFSAGDDHCVRSWDIASGAEKKSGSPRTILLSCLDVSPDGRWIAAGGYDDLIVVYDTESLNSVATLAGHTHDLRALAFSPDSRLLASGGRDEIIRLWNVPDFELVGIREGHVNTVRSLTWAGDGQLYSSDGGGRVLAWGSDGHVIRERMETEGVHSLAFAPAGLRIPLPTANQDVSSFNPKTPKSNNTQETNAHSIITLQADELLALGMNHGTVRLWHLPTDSIFFETQHHGVEIRSLAFSPDGRTLAVGGSDEAVYLWHVATGRNVLTFGQLGSSVHRVAFSPDGASLLAAMHDGTIRIWRAPPVP